MLSFFLVCMWLCLVASQSTRPDGKCGPQFLAGNNKPATCEHIPPFPTCCQPNGHCGWDCEDLGASPQAAPARAASSEALAVPGAGLAEPEPGLRLEGGGLVRSDRRCGKEFPLPGGQASQCAGASKNPCCSAHGYCGPGPAHCACAGCIDYRSGAGVEVPLVRGKVRTDRRCGPKFLLDDGSLTECDGGSENHCCSQWGYCGPGPDHCACDTCKDYRTPEQKLLVWEGRWRKDRRCGPEFPIPGTQPAQPAECNPDSETEFCCSKWGYCGGDEEHCACKECVAYGKK